MMDSKLLIDSLTAHISLYHSPTPSSSPNPRTSILRWFSSLTIHQRQSYLTIVDENFTEILIEMQSKLRTNGPGCFIILPDLPSRDRPSLPSLCFRRSRGLLARVSDSNESERMIYQSVRLFGSSGGERIDSMTVSEEFVANMDRFVAVMDRVSGGEFLRGEESNLGSAWKEMDWLKGKGYYCLAAFMANKLELALRLSWLHCNNGGKRKGAKSKEKADVAGIASNMYWRNKGCLDWWAALDPGVRKKIFRIVLVKAAKFLTSEIVKGQNIALELEMQLFSAGTEQPLRFSSTLARQRSILEVSAADAEFRPPRIQSQVSGKQSRWSNFCNCLFVLQEISSMIVACQYGEYENEKLFFSTLGSIHTISDSILRKLRGLLMVISSDCLKLELFEGENMKSSEKKSIGKLGVGSRRGKGKNRNLRKLSPMPKSCGATCAMVKPPEGHGSELASNETAHPPNASVPQGEDNQSLEHHKGLVVGKVGKKSRKENTRSKTSSLMKPVILDNSEVKKATSPSDSFQIDVTKSNCLADASTVQNLPNDLSIGTSNNLTPNSSCNKPDSRDDDEVTKNKQEGPVGSTEGSCHLGSSTVSSGGEILEYALDPQVITTVPPVTKLDGISNNELKHQNLGQLSGVATQPLVSSKFITAVDSNEEAILIQGRKAGNCQPHGPTSSLGCTSYEWPSLAAVQFSSVNSQHLPAATDRLHLDVGRNWRNHFHQSFVSTRHQPLNPPIEGGRRIVTRPLPMSLDWPPMVRSASRLTPSVTCSYDSGFIPRLQPPYRQSFAPHSLQINGKMVDDESKYSGDILDSCDLASTPELADDSEGHWVSEEEFEVHAFSGRDYNQYFGGGVMYWNSSDPAGSGFSRPPSLSSEDSSWAWHEADLNRAIDDMVGLSSSYSTNGLTSPPAAPFCSPFDPLGPGHQPLGYVIPANEVTGKVLHASSSVTDGAPEGNVSGSLANSSGGVVEGQNGDLLPYPILPPIIIPNMSRKGSRSEFKLSHDHKSPCIHRTRREQPRIKRPPSPVVLCVPRPPCPPPPSPVGESRKRRGFPTVRSGSSSPRHWGMRSWYHDGTNCEEARLCVDGTEVIWPSWRSKGLSTTPMIQPLPGALLQDRLIAISQLALDREHPDVALPLQPPELQNSPARKVSLSLIHSLLHDEIDSFCKQVASKNLIRKPYINWAVKRVARSLQVLWPRSRTNIFGSNATGLSLPTSDVDLVVCLPPVRNLEPIKEAGILEGRNGIKETCLQHAARYLANQEWVKNDSLKTVENTAIPIIMLVAEVPHDVIASSGNTSNEHTPKVESIQITGEESKNGHSDQMGSEKSSWKKCLELKNDDGMDVKSVRLDISFKSPSHTGLQTTELVRELTEQFPAATPLALVLKQFLADRSLDHSYSGGLSSYCLVLLVTRFLQHEHHLGRPINQNLGSLLMDFLYFFGNVFDPRQMRISIQGTGVYVNRERGHCIDPIHIDDPLFPTNNVGRNCFRIHQCIKCMVQAFADAYSILENELTCLPSNGDTSTSPPYRLLPKIIPKDSMWDEAPKIFPFLRESTPHATSTSIGRIGIHHDKPKDYKKNSHTALAILQCPNKCAADSSCLPHISHRFGKLKPLLCKESKVGIFSNAVAQMKKLSFEGPSVLLSHSLLSEILTPSNSANRVPSSSISQSLMFLPRNKSNIWKYLTLAGVPCTGISYLVTMLFMMGTAAEECSDKFLLATIVN
ncbi:PAP/25A-associated [Macleaya cordata]|uniref:PAP/25A-associated n=1 Tax=Macleaya cordata TaxID=56857 RepID=A0A200R8H8_MACCD|nr:PAP/25A-associated [Macleaya cordata]